MRQGKSQSTICSSSYVKENVSDLSLISLLYTHSFSFFINRAVFFYVGNEADVTLYVEHTGLMWENAQAMNARIVFAEHR